ncbi:hypothetical protein F8M41_017607 [Gigaspora margarita]|uniref:Uncharacterized protein n=1 Tax=Gigaspora margarita TaxID=4874 RepID=A0A8H4AMR1_GIGMA|nr:hypothetical protein F8M41_017607 [Gigaspora margarita]
MIPVPHGRRVVLEFSILVRDYYTLRGRGLLFGFKPENTVAFIEVDVKELSPIPDSSYTLFNNKTKKITLCDISRR